MNLSEEITSALIVTGGYCRTEALTDRLPAADLVIAADSGQKTCAALGLTPDLICGDFDSSPEPSGTEAEIVRVPVRKNDTDTMLACELAVKRGAKRLTIVGGTGGRIDHTFSNVFFLEALKNRGIEAILTDGNNAVRILQGGETVTLPKRGFRYFSVFALTDAIVSESGCEYPLDKARLRRVDPFAVSNEIKGDAATVRVHEGTVLVTESGFESLDKSGNVMI